MRTFFSHVTSLILAVFFIGCGISSSGTTNNSNNGKADDLKPRTGRTNASWAIKAGGSKVADGFEGDWGWGVVVDSEGNSYITGDFSIEAFFGATGNTMISNASSESSAFVAKYNPNGRLLWVTSVGGPGMSSGHRIALSPNGEIFILGSVDGAIVFDRDTTTFQSSNSYTAFVAKMDKDTGAFLSVTPIEALIPYESKALAVDANGDLFVAGMLEGDAMFGNTSVLHKGEKDIAIVKISNTGRFVWAKSIGIPRNNYVQPLDISVDKNNDLYIISEFQNEAMFDNGLSFAPNRWVLNAFIAKYDGHNGDLNWAEPLQNDGQVSIWGSGIVVDSAQNIYISGRFEYDSIDAPHPQNNEIFVAKISTQKDQFNYEWTTTSTKVGRESPYPKIVLDNNENPVIAADFYKTIPFGRFAPISQVGGIVVAGFSKNNGSVLWTETAFEKENAPFSEMSSKNLAVDKNGNFFVCGNFSGDIQLGNLTLSYTSDLKDPNKWAGYDIFLWKLSPCLGQSTQQNSQCVD